MARPFRFSKIAKRFLLSIIPVSLSGIVLVGSFTYYLTKERILENITTEITTLGGQAESAISNFFRQTDTDLENLADTPLIYDYHANAQYGLMEEAEQYRQEIEQYFLRFASRRDTIAEIQYIDRTGKEICRISGKEIKADRKNWTADAFFTKILNLEKYSIFRTEEKSPSGAMLIVSAMPLFTRNGKLSGAIVVKTKSSDIQNTLNNLTLGKTGTAYFIDSSGAVLLHAAQTPPGATAEKTIDRKYPISNTGFTLGISANPEDFLSPLKKIRNYTLIFLFICLMIVSIALYFLINNTVSPINELVIATTQLATTGKYTPVQVAGNDEVHVLAESFNSMAKKLLQRTDELESRIRELVSLQLMGGALIKRLDKDAIGRVCLDTAVKGLGFERGILYMIDDSGNYIQGRYVYLTEKVGLTESEINTRKIPIDSDDIIAQTAKNRQPINVMDPSSYPGCNPRFLQESDTKAFCMAPIMTQDRVYGVIAADNYYSGKSITDEQLTSLSLFANSAGLALENSDLISDISQSEERYRVILDSTAEAIIGLDGALNIIIWNRGAETVFGASLEQVKNRPLAQFLDNTTFGLITESIKIKSFFEGRNLTGKTFTGRELKLDIHWALTHKETPQDNEWAVVIRNVTEFNKLQSQLIQAEKMAAVGQLISGITHELNNPMTVIRGYAELMKSRAVVSGAKTEEIDAIYINAKRCSAIIDNFLSFARATSNHKKLVDLKSVVDATMPLAQFRIKNNLVRIEQNCPNILPGVMCNFQQIEQVVVNILQNAIDSLLQRGNNRELSITLSSRNGMVALEITDNGPGISPEKISQIFEPFFTTKEEGMGTGLGLSICKQIIDMHGGRISVVSTPFEMTKFTVELPIAKDVMNEPESPIHVPGLNTGGKILVIDDEKDVLALLNNILRDEGQNVDTAANGADALEKAKTNKYDVILCDMEMSPINGFEVYESLPKAKFQPKFIFMTGKILTENNKMRLAKWKTPCINKPFGIKELLHILNSPTA